MLRRVKWTTLLSVALFAAFLILHYNKMMIAAAITLVAFSLVVVFTSQT